MLLKRYYGYQSFRGSQRDIINNILSRRDVLAVMPTGAGKSLCYQIPALSFEGITLVISPLISLMQDQVRSLIGMGVRAAYLNSSLTPRQLMMATDNARRGVYKIIYVAPERLETDDFIDFAANADVSLIAVDEAHCISQWGHDFRPSYTHISDFISRLPYRPVIAAFTATATGVVKDDIVRQLKLSSPYRITAGFDRENLYFGVCRPFDKDKYILDYVSSHIDQSGIIYCGTRKKVDEVTRFLQENDISALPYHAGMRDDDRAANQEAFTYDRARVIVATTAFGMGIDKPDVRYVLHYNMPGNIEDYYQQAGRAGRDGEPASCILLYHGSDVMLQRFLIEKSAESYSGDDADKARFLENEREKLKFMTFYSTSKNVCLRKRILSYFGESFSPPCRNCSVCLENTEDKSVFAVREKNPSQSVSSGRSDNEPMDEALFGRLKKYRSYTAARAGLPAYCVLNDAALRELSVIKPRKMSELAGIKGFGEVKLQKYGKDVLDIINQYEDEADF